VYVAFEFGKKELRLALTSGVGGQPWVRTVPSGDLTAAVRLLERARVRLGVSAAAPVLSCYEAGRDGFWIHRALTQLGLCNRVVDSASIEVNRRARRTKSDRIDAVKRVRMLAPLCLGEAWVWQEVRVPSATAEAARQANDVRSRLGSRPRNPSSPTSS
jgi:transposase